MNKILLPLPQFSEFAKLHLLLIGYWIGLDPRSQMTVWILNVNAPNSESVEDNSSLVLEINPEGREMELRCQVTFPQFPTSCAVLCCVVLWYGSWKWNLQHVWMNSVFSILQVKTWSFFHLWRALKSKIQNFVSDFSFRLTSANHGTDRLSRLRCLGSGIPEWLIIGILGTWDFGHVQSQRFMVMKLVIIYLRDSCRSLSS
jgi:hypothetical protein